jgi:NAD-dependent SIR2 family protein deacetylase
VQTLSNLIKQSKHPIFFTGAGISTSTGIPDYRSGQSTLVPTGPGIWNRTSSSFPPPNLRTDKIIDDAIPSLTHMAIKTLINKHIFKFIISQNIDGLHVKSGIIFKDIA